jgi:hypothetical protein
VYDVNSSFLARLAWALLKPSLMFCDSPPRSRLDLSAISPGPTFMSSFAVKAWVRDNPPGFNQLGRNIWSSMKISRRITMNVMDSVLLSVTVITIVQLTEPEVAFLTLKGISGVNAVSVMVPTLCRAVTMSVMEYQALIPIEKIVIFAVEQVSLQPSG